MFFFFKQKTAYEMRISDWSSDVCSSDLNAPIGSQIVPYPESPETDMTALGRSFRGQRGRVLLRESVAVTAAGGPAPQADWRPQDVTPDLSRAMTADNPSPARDSVCTPYGALREEGRRGGQESVRTRR